MCKAKWQYFRIPTLVYLRPLLLLQGICNDFTKEELMNTLINCMLKLFPKFLLV
jgi:hypothetical protein